MVLERLKILLYILFIPTIFYALYDQCKDINESAQLIFSLIDFEREMNKESNLNIKHAHFDKWNKKLDLKFE